MQALDPFGIENTMKDDLVSIYNTSESPELAVMLSYIYSKALFQIQHQIDYLLIKGENDGKRVSGKVRV